MNETLTPEPEELLESRICALLSDAATIPVEGMFTTSSAGTVKGLDADTFISVTVDRTGQVLDYVGAGSIYTFSARIAVRFAQADDKDERAFRDECRRVSSALRAMSGDGCSAISTADALACDGFMVTSTYSAFEGGDNPTRSKTFTATINGRNLTTTTAA